MSDERFSRRRRSDELPLGNVASRWCNVKVREPNVCLEGKLNPCRAAGCYLASTSDNLRALCFFDDFVSTVNKQTNRHCNEAFEALTAPAPAV